MARHLVILLALFVAVAVEAKHFQKRQANWNRCSNRRNGDKLANNNDCSSYVECFNNAENSKWCPQGQEFIAASQVCSNPPFQPQQNCRRTVVIGGGTNNNNNVDCSNRNNGETFPDNNDCSAFYSCWNSEASLMKCGPGLEYNSTTRQCDYPPQQPTNCRRTIFDIASKKYANLCGNNPTGKENWAFLVAHPTLCNSYFTCSPNYIHKPCHLCPQGTYFPQGGRTCVHLPGGAPEQFCEQGRRFVQHKDIPMMMISPECTE